jgi:hypothetical protein
LLGFQSTAEQQIFERTPKDLLAGASTGENMSQLSFNLVPNKD